MMGKNNYYRSNKKSWSKDLRRAFRDLTDSIIKNIACRTSCGPNVCGSNGARWCIYALIVLTLLFSGIGFYSWVIIGMLCLVLQFV